MHSWPKGDCLLVVGEADRGSGPTRQCSRQVYTQKRMADIKQETSPASSFGTLNCILACCSGTVIVPVGGSWPEACTGGGTGSASAARGETRSALAAAAA